MPSKVAVQEEDETPVAPAKKFKPNYRCILPDSANVQSECPDFFLPWKELSPDGFVCPQCGSRKLLPLF